MSVQLNPASRVAAAFQSDCHDQGLLAPLEGLGAIYPQYGRSLHALEETEDGSAHAESQDIDMGIGAYFPPPPAVIQACIRALREGHTHYLDLPELKDAIVSKLAEENEIIVESQDQILLVGGARTGMILSALALLNLGDGVLIPDPDYIGLAHCTRLVGAEPIRVPMTKDKGMFRFDPQRMADSVTPRTKGIMFCNPNNPTGYLYSRTDLQFIADLAERHNLFVVVNELYDRLTFDGARHISLGSLPGMIERSVTIQGLTKIYDVSGLRIGWMIASKRMGQVLADLRFLACQALPPSISQYGAVAALTSPVREDHVQQVLRLYVENRDRTAEMLNGHCGVVCPKPMAGHFAFADVSFFGLGDVETARFLKRQAHVLTVPGSVWGFCGRGHLRLALANDPEVQAQGLNRLRKGLELLARGNHTD